MTIKDGQQISIKTISVLPNIIADPFIEIMSPSDGDIRPEELEYPCRVQYI